MTQESVTDIRAVELIQDNHAVGFFVHTGTEQEHVLAAQIPAFEAKFHCRVYMLSVADITSPHETLFAFVRYPRLLLYRNQGTEREFVGFSAIEELVQ